MKKKIIILLICINIPILGQNSNSNQLISESISKTLQELKKINNKQSIAKKHNISYPLKKTVFSKKKLNQKIELAIAKEVEKSFKIDEKQLTVKAKKKFPFYSVGDYISLTYIENNNQKTIKGYFKGLQNRKININGNYIPLTSLDKVTQNSFFKLFIRNAREDFINITKEEIILKKNQYAKKIRIKILKKYGYIKYKKKWYSPEDLYLSLLEKTNIKQWFAILEKQYLLLAKKYNYSYTEGKFTPIKIKPKEEIIYYNSNF